MLGCVFVCVACQLYLKQSVAHIDVAQHCQSVDKHEKHEKRQPAKDSIFLKQTNETSNYLHSHSRLTQDIGW